MKTTTILSLVIASTLSLAGCGEKTDQSATKEQSSSTEYPLTTCVVSGEELGSMGEPVVVEHGGTKVKLCCDQCIDKFNSDPAKYTKMVTDAR